MDASGPGRPKAEPPRQNDWGPPFFKSKTFLELNFCFRTNWKLAFLKLEAFLWELDIPMDKNGFS